MMTQPTGFKPFSFIAALNGVQQVVHNSSWLLLDRLLRLGLGLLFNVWLARYLGPSQYGLFNYATAFVTLFSVFVTLGLDAVVVRDLGRAPEQRDIILGSVLALRFLGALLSVALVIGVIAYTQAGDWQLLSLVIIIALGNLFQIFDTIDLWFQAQMQARLTVYAKSAAFLLLIAIKLLLIKLNAPLAAFAWASAAELALGAAGLLLIYRQQRTSFWQWQIRATAMWQLLSASWPLLLNSLAILVQARIDQVLLGNLISTAEVGQYAVALRLVEVLGLFSVVVQTSVAPLVTRAKKQGETEYYHLLLNVYRLMFLLFILTALPLCLVSKWLVVGLFGSQYAAAGALLPWFAPRIFFTNFGVAKQLFIVNDNLLRFSLITTAIGATLNVVLNYLLIPRYAAWGALAAMTLSSLVNLFCLDMFYAEARGNLHVMVKGSLTAWRLQIPAFVRQ